MSGKNNFRRYNPLIDEWIIVAVNRINRPWQGAKTENSTASATTCSEKIRNSLAPMGKRSTGVLNENYLSTYVFENDFPSFTEFEECAEEEENSDLFKQQEVKGVCRVICYHPDSQLTLATMNIKEKYFEKNASVLLMDYLKQEMQRNKRIVITNNHWTCLVPYWAFWPYETILLPNRHVERYTDLEEAEKQSLAEILRSLLIKYDNIFECSFPYMMGWSGAPTGSFLNEDCSFWQLHLSFFPPLLRSAIVPKFLAGYEVFSEKQRDISPEIAAKTLREMDEEHYSNKLHS